MTVEMPEGWRRVREEYRRPRRGGGPGVWVTRAADGARCDPVLRDRYDLRALRRHGFTVVAVTIVPGTPAPGYYPVPYDGPLGVIGLDAAGGDLPVAASASAYRGVRTITRSTRQRALSPAMPTGCLNRYGLILTVRGRLGVDPFTGATGSGPPRG